MKIIRCIKIVIDKVERLIDKENEEKRMRNEEKEKYEEEINENKTSAMEKIWEIKSEFTGGDGVFEYCLDGLKGKKESLFNYLLSVSKPDDQPKETIVQLKKEIESIRGDTAQKYTALPELELRTSNIEQDDIFSKVIIGNKDSSVSALIQKLGNSDWVKDGLEYLPDTIGEGTKQCPFCQSNTITKNLQESIKGYFDQEYNESISQLKELLKAYSAEIKKVPSIEAYTSSIFIMNKEKEFIYNYKDFKRELDINESRIKEKIKSPSHKIQLESTERTIGQLNELIKKINKAISSHNEKIDNKDNVLLDLKKTFWNIMRWEYDQIIFLYKKERNKMRKKVEDTRKEIKKIKNVIEQHRKKITQQQKKTINIEEAIININQGLLELGIDSFSLEKYEENLYRIVRLEECNDTFQTLSEGEKMIISFLYFREYCKGKQNPDSKTLKKIVVIDDPMSSLSHIFVFNIGELIKEDFFRSEDIEQVFVLTHSLYFFYELTDINHQRRKETQKLFRLAKNFEGTSASVMQYEEIQNDYQSYWLVVKDDKQQPALIANCMRNIIEHFFSFVEKKDLNNAFQNPKLKEQRFQAFKRFINRESHSLGQNISDYNEFNYLDFKEAFGLVFELNGYKDHYDKMMK